MITTPQQYNELLESNRIPAKEKIAQVLNHKIETRAEHLEGTPFEIVLRTYRDTTEEERAEWDAVRTGRRAPTKTIDWTATQVEAEIAIELLKEAGWHVKDDKPQGRGFGTSGFAVWVNDVPFEDPETEVERAYEEALAERAERRNDEIKALIVVQQFNNKGWWRRLFTTKL